MVFYHKVSKYERETAARSESSGGGSGGGGGSSSDRSTKAPAPGTAASNAKINMLTAILFLAGKSTENIRRIREVLNVVRYLYGGHRPDDLSLNDYQGMKEAVVEQEHCLLRILAFNMEVDLPHIYLLNVARLLQVTAHEVKCAWKYLNGSFASDRILRESPALVALASLRLGCDRVYAETQRGLCAPSCSTAAMSCTKWWDQFDVDEKVLNDTCRWVSETNGAA